MKKRKSGPIGSSFESWLTEEGILDEATEHAVKAVIAWQLEQAMKQRHLSKTALAELLGTSRTEIYRLLDPRNDGVSLATLRKAAAAVGRRLKIELVDDAA
jgi:antitoxin HicB